MYTRVMKPANGFTADLIRFVPHFERLQVSWTACAPMSAGVEKFVDEYLPKIRANNPEVKFPLFRTNVLCDPFIVGVYRHNRMKKHRCCWRTAEQILMWVEQMSIGGDFRSGRAVNKNLPRGLQILNAETMGHDVFKVYSKYKGDPPSRHAVEVADHPNYVHKFML